MLIVSPGEVNFFGEGGFVRGLDQAFPGGWSGGALPERGFWGQHTTEPQAVVKWLVENMPD
ncbi:MAG: hypothetical protein HY735_35575 [Verrucomicrobia bacterium]|nr:hypothetical protein [Verrucomicrobiota bacterium]